MTRPARALGVALLLVSCACAEGVVGIAGAWARPTSSGPTAAYLSIHNGTRRAVRLTRARSACCATIELHRTTIRDDRMSMAPASEGVVIESGATLTLEPGGHHLMLFEPHEPLRHGMRFELTLEFESGAETSVEVEVRR